MLSHHLEPPNKIVFSWPDRDCRTGFRTSIVQCPQAMDAGWRDAFIEAFKRRAFRGAELNIHCYRKGIISIFRYIDASESLAFPPDNWENHMYGHFEWCLSDATQKPKVRLETWAYSRRIYLELVRLERVPASAHIPDNIIRGGCLDETSVPLGANIEHLDVPSELDFVLPKHMLVAKGLELDDDEYLLGVKDKFKQATDAVMAGCLKYWAEMKRCHELGRQLRESISSDNVIRVLTSGNFFNNGIHLADPDAPEGPAWALAVAHHYLLHRPELGTLNNKQLKQTPFFRQIMNSHRKAARVSRRFQEIAGQMPIGTPTTDCLTRLLGLLSQRDCAVASSILIIENPSFTPMSLTNADIYTQAGRFYLRARDANSRLVFSVAKPRACKRKVSVLSLLSAQIITDVIQCTAKIRARLKNVEKRNWRKLFLFASKQQLGSSRDIAKTMSQTKNSVSNVYFAIGANFSAVRIEEKGFTLSALRTAQAIICFLESGSLKMVADILGNTVRTVRKHYIPPWLIVHWAGRIVRIMQQKLIIIATEGYPWQFEATDFVTEEQLRIFITKMLCSIKHGDALSQLIVKKLSKYADSGFLRPFIEAEFAIKLDPESIAVIHAYAVVFNASSEQDLRKITAVESSASISRSAINSLSKLMRETINLIDQELSFSEAAVLEKISGDSIAQFKKVHRDAEHKVDYYVELFKRHAHSVALLEKKDNA